MKLEFIMDRLEFIGEFQQGERVETSDTTAFSCEYVYDAIRSSTTVDALRGRQEDAQEFLGFLLDGIHEELLASLDKPKSEVEGTEEWTRVIYPKKFICFL